MRRSLLLLVLIGYSMICLSQNSATVSGRIIDKQSLEPIAGATVSAYRTNNATLTDNEGRFTLKNLKEGKSTLVISHVSYESEELSIVNRDNNKEIQVALTLANKIGNEVVVSASRRPEKITYAPANIYVINAGHLSEFAGSNVGELLSYIPAVEYLRSGVDQTNFNSRGFNNAFNNKTFQIVDGRNSMNVGSAGLPILNNGTTNKEDLERLEIVLGPQSALYGPNGLNTVLNYITKDPRKHSGTTVALTAGNQNQFSTRFRHAETLNKKFAYKLTGEYSAGTEFLFYDSVRAGGSVYGPAVSIPEHNVDFDFKHLRGEAHLYYTVNPKADIILSGGASNNDYFQMTTLGRNQMRDWRFGFLQARFVHKNLFLNVYNSWGDLGRSYGFHPYTRDFWNRTHSTITDPADPRYATMGRLSPDSAELFALRLGNMFKEHNQRSNAEAQYNYSIEKAGLTIVTGLAWQQDRPRSYGITLVDKDRRISVTQYGAVMQLQKTLPWQSKFIAAGRADNHSKFGTFFSPKIGIVTTIGDGSARLTWGRAFSMPSILAQSSGTGGVRFGNGDGISYIPNGAKVSDPASVQTTIPIKPEEVRTWELGYRGTIKKSLFVDVNLYTGNNINFLSPTQSIGGRALFVGDIPVQPAFPGTVENDILKNASFLTYFNYGNVIVNGIDVSLNYAFSRKLSFAVKYSWFDSDIRKEDIKNDANKDNYISAEETSLNAAPHRGVAILNLHNLSWTKAFFNIAARFVAQYDFYSGNQVGTASGKGRWGSVYRGPHLPPLPKNFDQGPLGGFTSFDLGAGTKLNEMVAVAMRISNVFNTRQIEFVGAPSIGRLYSVELKVHVPSASKK